MTSIARVITSISTGLAPSFRAGRFAGASPLMGCWWAVLKARLRILFVNGRCEGPHASDVRVVVDGSGSGGEVCGGEWDWENEKGWRGG